MKLMRILAILMLLSLPAGMAGCGGGGAEIKQQTTTLGQELQDLDDAYKKGLLSEKEYKELREELIDKYSD